MSSKTIILDTPIDADELRQIQNWLAKHAHCSVAACALLQQRLDPASD